MAKLANTLFRITEVTDNLELTSATHTVSASSHASSQSWRRRQATQRKKLREAVVSFSEAGGRREPFATAQQLDFSGFATTVDARTNATKDLRNNADSLRDPFATDPHMEVPHHSSSPRDPFLLIFFSICRILSVSRTLIKETEIPDFPARAVLPLR